MKKSILLISHVVLTYCIIAAQTVTIGKQVWMTKNLDVRTFRNGDPIPYAGSDDEWKKAGENRQPAWCFFYNDSANGEKYGKLYNWFAVNDSRGLAPTGYRIPTNEEWTQLTNFLGGNKDAGEKMKSKAGWKEDGNGTNSSGFSGLPGGGRNQDGSFFANNGHTGYWWTSTESEYNSRLAWYRNLNYEKNNVVGFFNRKEHGLSVRCLKK